MARRRKRKAVKKKNKIVFNLIKKVFLSTQYFPVILCATTICILFVLFRMKGIEQDYAYHESERKMKKLVFHGKELKAQKARLLSIDNLRGFANKYGLVTPSQNKIIVIK